MSKPELEGTWPADDLRRAFVMGAKWWEFHSAKFTMWPSDQNLAEAEAERRYPGGRVPEDRLQLPESLLLTLTQQEAHDLIGALACASLNCRTEKLRQITDLAQRIIRLNSKPVRDAHTERAVMYCKFCHEPCDPMTAHLHDGELVGDECCWDERLRSSE